MKKGHTKTLLGEGGQHVMFSSLPHVVYFFCGRIWQGERLEYCGPLMDSSSKLLSAFVSDSEVTCCPVCRQTIPEQVPQLAGRNKSRSLCRSLLMHLRRCGKLIGAGERAMAEACVVLLGRAELSVNDIEMPLLVKRDTIPNLLQVGTIICQMPMPLYIHSLAGAVCAYQAYVLGLYPTQTAVTAHISQTLSAVETVAYLAAVDHAGKPQQRHPVHPYYSSVVKMHDLPRTKRITNVALRHAKAHAKDHSRRVTRSQAVLQSSSSARSSNEDATQVDQVDLTDELIFQVLDLRKQVDSQSKHSEDLSVRVLELRKQVVELTIQSEELSDRLTCSICLDDEISTMLMPCRHLCTCAGCTVHLIVCPLCTETITDTRGVYIK